MTNFTDRGLKEIADTLAKAIAGDVKRRNELRAQLALIEANLSDLDKSIEAVSFTRAYLLEQLAQREAAAKQAMAKAPTG